MVAVLFASMSQKSQPPSLYDVLMQRYWSCKTVARVLCLVAREWLGSYKPTPISIRCSDAEI